MLQFDTAPQEFSFIKNHLGVCEVEMKLQITVEKIYIHICHHNVHDKI